MSEAPYPPAELPADGDRTSQVPPPGAPRYSASASVPVPPPAGGPTTYGAQSAPATYGQPAPGNTYGQPAGQGQGYPGQPQPPMGQAPMGQMGQASMGQAPMGQGQMGQAPMGQLGQPPMGQANPAGQARVGGSASVPGTYPPPPAPSGQSMPTTYGAAPQTFAAPSGVYGGQPQPGQPQPGQPYGQQPGFGQAPPPVGQNAPMGQTYGQSAYAPPPQQQQQQQQPERGRDKMVPTGGWPYVEQENVPPAPKSRKGLTIFLAVLAVLVVVGVGGYVGLRLATRSDVYTVNACVRQDGTEASVVDCGASGAYKITQIVDDESQCPDATQPSLLLSDGDKSRVACLGPATP